MSKKPKKVVVPKPHTNKTTPPQFNFTDKIGLTAELPYENLQSKSLFVCTPMYGGQCFGTYTRSLLNLVEICKDIGIMCYVHFLYNESLIQRARNYCCDEFMRAKIGYPPPEGMPDNRPHFTHMLFIDSDISFDPKDILFMLAISDIGSDKDVICGPYPKKCISWEKIKAAVDKGAANGNPNNLERFVGDYVFNPKGQGNIPLGQPVEILEGGTGFMLIQRQAFEKFAAKFPEQSYRPDHVRTANFDGSREIMAYFDCPIDRGYTPGEVTEIIEGLLAGEDIDTLKTKAQDILFREKTASKRYLSEDYMFCQYLQKAGGKVWLLPWVKLQHTGTYVFGGSLIDIAMIGQSATADPSQLGGKK